MRSNQLSYLANSIAADVSEAGAKIDVSTKPAPPKIAYSPARRNRAKPAFACWCSPGPYSLGRKLNASS